MSSPPPYGSPNETPTNPDSRPLPPGWMQQYDANYRTWFYVNTNTQPPSSSWTHPAGLLPPPPAPPPTQYQSPPGPPERSQHWGPESQYGVPQNQYGSSQGQWGIPQQQSWGGGFPPSGPGYGQPQGGLNPLSPSDGGEKSGKKSGGGLLGFLKPSGGSSHGPGFGGFGSSSGHGGGHGQPFGGFGQQHGYAKPPKKHGGGGMGGAGMLAAGAGAGLLGGLLVADAVDDFGDDFGGGDFGDF